MYNVDEMPNTYCLIALTFQLISLMTDLVYWQKYSINGESVVLLDYSTTIFEMASESIMTILLLMIASGWMIKDSKLDARMDKYYIPFSLVVIAVHLCIGCLTFIDQDAYHKFHDFNGW